MRLTYLSLIATAHASNCALPWERAWKADVALALKKLLSSDSKYKAESLCMPVFNPIKCTPVQTDKVCTSEIETRTGYKGYFRLPQDDLTRCYVQMRVVMHNGEPEFSHASYSNYCENAVKLSTTPSSMSHKPCDYGSIKLRFEGCVNQCFGANVDISLCIDTCSAQNKQEKATCQGEVSIVQREIRKIYRNLK